MKRARRRQRSLPRSRRLHAASLRCLTMCSTIKSCSKVSRSKPSSRRPGQPAAGALKSVYRDARTCRVVPSAQHLVMLLLRSRKRYKKCGRTFKVRITPYMADEIESFESPLSDYLQDQLGVEEGGEVEAESALVRDAAGHDFARHRCAKEWRTPTLRGVGAQNAARMASTSAQGRRPAIWRAAHG